MTKYKFAIVLYGAFPPLLILILIFVTVISLWSWSWYDIP